MKVNLTRINQLRPEITKFAKNSWRWLPGLFSAVFITGLYQFGAWQPLEYIGYNRMMNLRGERSWDDRIVVIAQDDSTVDKLGKLPWKTDVYQQLLEKLESSQPQVIALDLTLSDTGVDIQPLINQLKRLPVVILARDWDLRGLPIKASVELEKSATAVGNIYYQEDHDGVIRYINTSRSGIPNLGVITTSIYNSRNNKPIKIPHQSYLYINWPGKVNGVKTYSAQTIIAGKFPTNLLKNKIVLIGSTISGIHQINTPFERKGTASSVYLQAAVIDNLLNDSYLRRLPRNYLIMGLFMLAPIISLWLSYHNHDKRLFIIILLLIGVVVGGILCFHFNYWLPIVAPISLLLITGVILAYFERIYVDSLLEKQIQKLWQTHQINVLAQPIISSYDLSPKITKPPLGKVSKLAALAEDFGRAQSAHNAITQSLSIGLIAADLNGTVWFCNSVASQLLNFHLGAELPKYLIPNWLSLEEWNSYRQTLVDGGYVNPKEIERENQYFLLKIEPLLNWQTIDPYLVNNDYQENTSIVSGVLVVIEDITAIRQLQTLLLDVEVQRRQELTRQNIALEKSRQLAEAALKVKSAFLANMSHEIRTPMNAVVGLTSLLLETNLTEQQQDFVQTIKISADNLLTIINEILDFSKIDSGEMQLESIDFSVTNCVEQVLEILANNAHSKGLQLSFYINPHIPQFVIGDPTRISQILTNLIGNAIKFTEKGGIVVDVDLLQNKGDQVILKFSVIDTGIGISLDSQSNIFQSFSQADSSTTRKYGGTGLGLAICQRLVTMMGGEIGVISDVDQGAKFWFNLPLKLTDNQAKISDLYQGVSLQNYRLLLVSNWLYHHQIIKRWGIDWGMTIDGADTIDRAVELINQYQGKYDFILIDNYLDYRLFRSHLNQYPKNNYHLVLMSNFAEYDLAQSLMGNTIDGYLFKPLKPLRLYDYLQKIIQPTIVNIAKAEPINSPIDRPVSHLKILVAEDNKINQKVVINQLKNIGYTAEIANNGQELLDKLAIDNYDLIFMDCHMPILDGYATTKAIRTSKLAYQDIIIIALTASAMAEDLEQAIASGMDDFLSKPVRKEQLLSKIEEWTHKKHQPTYPPPEIDFDYLKNLANGDEQFERSILRIFVDHVQIQLNKINKAIDRQDYEFITIEAQEIYETSCHVGAELLQRLTGKLAKQSDLQDIKNNLLPAINHELKAIDRWLQNN